VSVAAGMLVALAVATTPAQAAQSQNVKVLAQIPYLQTAISINFIDDAMFVSTVDGVWSYDVSDPAAPRLLDVLPMYIWENEDVDVDAARHRLYISRDPRGFTSPATPGSVFPFGAVHIIDVSNPSVMTQLNAFLVPAGHTTTCINRCDYIWTSGPVASTLTQPADWGGRPIFATDVTDPLNPKPCPEPLDTGRNDGATDYVHDVQVDSAGVAWVAGAGGVRGYWTSGAHRNPVTGNVETATGCKPVPFGGSGTPDKATPSRFMHNSWRDAAETARPKVKLPTCKQRSRKARRSCLRRRRALLRAPKPLQRSDVLLGTEEEVTTDCATAGRFVTFDLRNTYNGEGFRDIKASHHRMKVLGTWTPQNQEGSTGCASSHYFSSRGDGLTVNAFYTQGVRFLDSSDPTHIREVGYYVNSDSNTWAAYWHKGNVFVADFGRGVEVLSFSGAPARSVTTRAPDLHALQTLRFSPSSFAGLCPLSVPRRVPAPHVRVVLPAKARRALDAGRLVA
jgi:hypothetical protein